MKIGFDGKRAVQNRTGIGNYSRFVLEVVAKNFPSDRLLVYAPEKRDEPRLRPLQKLRNVKFRFAGLRGLKGALWRSFGICSDLLRDKPDIFHGLSNELPLSIRKTGIPSVLTMHDVIYRRLPRCYSFFDRKIYDCKYGRSCRIADHIIAVSERTKLDVMECYGVPEERITVVYQGCDASFAEPWSVDRLADLKRRCALPSRYMIQVGTVERRKNLELSLRALAELDDREICLVVVGRDFRGYKKRVQRLARKLGIDGRVLWYEGLPFEDLPGFYQASALALYPSRYEGFGIPVLEALSSGVPVIAASGSCLEETGGEAALYVGPDDVGAMASAMELLLTDVSERTRRIELGKIHAAKFSNAEVAAKVHAVYERVLSCAPEAR